MSWWRWSNAHRIKKISSDFKFPENIGYGRVSLNELKSLPYGFRFPEVIRSSLALAGLLKLPGDLRFPRKVMGDFNLLSIDTIPDTVKLPTSIDGDFRIGALKSYNPDSLPDHVGRDVYLGGKKLNDQEKEKFLKGENNIAPKSKIISWWQQFTGKKKAA